MEEKVYCPFCGKVNLKEQTRCSACGRELRPQDYRFRDYLLDTTKEELRSSADSSLFTIVKNWLLSHLYGLVLTVSLVSVVAVTVNARSAPYIRTVHNSLRPDAPTDTVPAGDIETPEPAGDTVSRIPKEELSRITYRVAEYCFNMDISDSDGAYESHSGMEVHDPSYYYLPEEYGFSGPKEYVPCFQVEGFFTYVDGESDICTINNPVTPLGKELLAAGYPVVEAEHIVSFYDESANTDEPQLVNTYYVVMAKADGDWYIAEMREK